MGTGITSWDNHLIHDKSKNFTNKRPFHIFVYRKSLNLIINALWFTLCYLIKFNNKTTGSFWKNLNSKGHRNWYNKIIGRLWSTKCGNRIKWEASREGTEYFYYACSKSWSKKDYREHRKCQVNFLIHLLWSSIVKLGKHITHSYN